jgi:hypothetical protein
MWSLSFLWCVTLVSEIRSVESYGFPSLGKYCCCRLHGECLWGEVVSSSNHLFPWTKWSLHIGYRPTSLFSQSCHHLWIPGLHKGIGTPQDHELKGGICSVYQNIGKPLTFLALIPDILLASLSVRISDVQVVGLRVLAAGRREWPLSDDIYTWADRWKSLCDHFSSTLPGTWLLHHMKGQWLSGLW